MIESCIYLEKKKHRILQRSRKNRERRILDLLTQGSKFAVNRGQIHKIPFTGMLKFIEKNCCGFTACPIRIAYDKCPVIVLTTGQLLDFDVLGHLCILSTSQSTTGWVVTEVLFIPSLAWKTSIAGSQNDAYTANRQYVMTPLFPFG